jgi:hypothetical protein
MKSRWTLNLVLSLSAMTMAFGQQGTSTLAGTVVDPNSAVIPNASVKLTNIENGATRNLVTGPGGEFRFEALFPGEYRLEVTSQGFKTFNLDQIALQSSETRGLGNLVMQLGTLSETVAVVAEVTPVQTASSEKSQTVNSDQLGEVTLKGRDPFGYLHLTSGVVDTNPDRELTQNGSVNGISINGMDYQHVQTAMDGASTQQMACNCGSFVVPNLEAISEVRVLINGIQAEFGRNAGGTINFVTKSGTSHFHGTFHWDHRNEDFNANSFFNNRSNIPLPIYRYLILGGSLGGPAYIPKVMPKWAKGKFFFFYSPEYATSKQPTSVGTVNEPTALERTGDFSKTFYATTAAPTAPILLTITDPNNGQKPFPGNMIPANRIDSIGLGMLNLLQLPNGYIAPATPYAYNASYSMTPGFYRLNNVLRVDGNMSSHVSAYYRWGRDQTSTDTVATSTTPALNGGSVTPGVGRYPSQAPGDTQVGHLTYVIGPTLIMEAQVTEGFTYSNSPGHTGRPDSTWFRSNALNPPTLRPLPNTNTFNGISPRNGYPLYPPYLPQATFTGGNYQNYSAFDPNAKPTPYENGDNQYVWRVDISKIWGKHASKIGIYWEHSSDFDEIGTNYNGLYNFGSSTANPLDTGDGYANALLGIFQSYTENSVRSLQARHYVATEWYLQDNWRVNTRLTLDYGVRFYHQSPTYDDSKYTSSFVSSMYTAANAPRLYYPGCKVAGATCSTANQIAIDPVTGATNFANYVGNLVPGVGSAIDGVLYPNPFGLRYQPLGVVPRFGFAYNVGGAGKTVIRGSSGMFEHRPNVNNLRGQNYAPVSYTPVVYYNTIPNLTQSSGGAVLPPSLGAIVGRVTLETVYQFNLTLERAIGFDTVVTIGYAGNFDRHGQVTRTQNNVALGAYALPQNTFSNTEINANLLRTQYPGMGSIESITNSLSLLNYHSLQSSIKRRFSHGLTFIANYQFSKALGTSTSWDPYHTGMPIATAFGTTVTLPSERQFYYGPTAYDRTHYGSASFGYLIPGPRILGKAGTFALSGWTLSGVTSFTTGAPVQPTCNTTAGFPANDPTWSGYATSVRCQSVGNWKDFTQSFYTNFNVSAFAYPSGGTQAAPVVNFGNTGLNFMRQPGWWNQDLTIAKEIRLGHETTARRLQVSMQAYNVLNHTEFNTIGTTYSFNAAGVNTNATTGQYTATQQPRQMVLTARFEF